MHTIQTMATLHNCSSEDSVAVTGRVEPGLLRLPLELRQHIYAIIFDSPRFVDLRRISVVLAYSRDMVYRPKLEKLREMSKRWLGSDDSKHDEVVDSGLEEYFEKKLSESDLKDAFLMETVMYEWRTGILEVSNAISNEALDVLYGQNVFVVDVHGRGYRAFLKFGVANLRRVRYLHIVARPMGISYGYGKPMMFDPQLWFPLLEGLLQLCIVAQQPLAARGDDGAPTLEEDLCEWTTWLDPMLKYFSTKLSKTTVVSIDDDGRAETTAMMDKYFDSGYQKVRTETGDVCFERGQYSWLSEEY